MFNTYSTKLLKTYNIIEQYYNKMATKSKAQRYLEGINIQSDMVIIIAMNYVKDNLHGNREEAAAYLSNKISEVFPTKNNWETCQSP